MTSYEALQFIVRLAGFKLVVRANRFGCDSDLAREAHDIVITVLDDMRQYDGVGGGGGRVSIFRRRCRGGSAA